MAFPVITVANTLTGGIAVIDVTASNPTRGMPVTEAPALTGGVKYGVAVTKVTTTGGIPVTYVTPPP